MKHSCPKPSFVISLILFCGLAVTGVCTASAATVTRLRCEYLVNPLGIQETAPRLSWIVESPRRGERQTAYEVLVASTAELLAKDQGDLWDSGKIETDDTAQVAYKGHPLESRAQCFWKIRCWDKDGKPSPWSKPAYYTIGLLKPEDWTAKWIEAGPIVNEEPATAVPVIRKAAYMNTFSIQSLDVTKLLKEKTQAGPFSLQVNNGSLGGNWATPHTKELFVEFDLAGRTMFKSFPENTQFSFPEGLKQNTSVPYLRKAFAIDKPVRKATLYATALGLYEMNLNGKRVGDQLMAPGWMSYRHRVRYQTYDVTAMIKPGANALGALVANGWYCGHIGSGWFQHSGKTPALLAQLEVTYADGSVQQIVTDATWKRHASPLLSADIMYGEAYDATQELAGWSEPGLDEKGWTEVCERKEAARALQSQVMEPIRQLAELHPKTITEPKPGQWTFDLGQNMVGVVRIKVSAPAGTVLTVRRSEVVHEEDGTLDNENYRGAPSTDNYICKGEGVEVWQPRFTYCGFRYVELTGLPSKPASDTVTGVVFGSDCPSVGEFSCSDPRVNQLQSNIQWTRRGNFMSVPTDCPQRAERLGWMGDAQVFLRTATFNADVAAFFTKWLVDVDDSQSPEGIFGNVSPEGGKGQPGWADAGVICPWTIYQAYGDTRVLERHWPAMVKYVEFCRANSTNLIRDRERFDEAGGDWLSVKADTSKELIGTAYFAYSTNLVAKSAKALGKTEEAAKYNQLFKDIKAAFIKKYVSADGHIEGNTQCGYALALQFDLLPDELRSKAAQYLDDDIKARSWHLSTGLLGTAYLLPMLTESGKTDTAFRLLMQDTFPSWLEPLKHGATTIWERWDGWPHLKDPSMNSFNHYALGSCGEWLFRSVAGIDCAPDQPAFKKIVIRPHIGGGLQSASAKLDSIRGTISSAWSVKNGKFHLAVTIPPNTTAAVYVPAESEATVTESGKPAAQAKGVKFLRMENGTALYSVEAGRYEFQSNL